MDIVERLTSLGVWSLDNTDVPIGDYEFGTKVFLLCIWGCRMAFKRLSNSYEACHGTIFCNLKKS